MPPITPTVRNLLIINVVLYFASGNLFSLEAFALHDIRSDLFQPHQLITHMFMHGSIMHLFGNMFSLFIFGPMLEKHWGSMRFLTFYFITGLGASFLYSAVRYVEISQMQDMVVAFQQNPDPFLLRDILEKFGIADANLAYLRKFQLDAQNPTMIADTQALAQVAYNKMLDRAMLGASGAVFGILMAFGMLFPNTELMLLFIPFPIKAKYFVLMYGAFELYTGLNRTPGDNVAHFAHLGGMLFAYILLKIWERRRTNFY